MDADDEATADGIDAPDATDAAGWSARLGWSAGVALLLMVAAAGYGLVYLPERARSRELDREMAAAGQRLAQLDEQRRRLEERVAALEAGDPVAVEEAIRDQLRHGREGEYVVAELILSNAEF